MRENIESQPLNSDLVTEITQGVDNILALISPEDQKAARSLLFQFYMRTLTLGSTNILATLPVGGLIKNGLQPEENPKKD